MGAAAAPIALGLQVAGTLSSAAAQAKAARHNAGINDQNAHLSEVDAANQELAIRDRERAVSGDAIAAMGANGVQLGTGSALDLLRQNAIAREHDVLSARYTGASRAAAYRDEAAGQRKAAKGALIGGLLGAGAQALSGYSSISNSRAVSSAQAAARLPGGTAMPIPVSLSGNPIGIY